MEEHMSHRDEVMNGVDCCPPSPSTNNTNGTRENDGQEKYDSVMERIHDKNDASETTEERFKICVLQSQQENENIPTLCTSTGDKDSEGNLLGSVVTMHNMTNCDDDDYSPTLAICDIFNKPKNSPAKNDSTQSKSEENKEEFLIIDLDTCQMERASKKTPENEYKEDRSRSNSPPQDLVLVNLSSEEVQSDYESIANDSDDSRNNFLLDTKDCDIQPCNHILTHTDKFHQDSDIPPIEKEKVISDAIDSKTQPQVKLSRIDADMKRESCLQNKGILFQDVQISDDVIMPKAVYSSDVSFHSNDLNASFHSHENQENESFYMPELYSRNYEEDKNSFHTSNTESENGNQFYEYSLDESASFDSPLSSNLYSNPTAHELFDQHQSQNGQEYNFESKIISNFVAMEKKDPSTVHADENTKIHRYKNRTNATTGSIKISHYSGAPDQMSTTPFFQPSCIPTYRNSFPYSSIQQPADAIQSLSSSSTSTYSDWNPWNNYPFYEVNLNTFPSVPNNESQCSQGKDDWCNDAIMTDLYQDPEMSIKSNQTEIDSEATEDADETDDVPIFFEDSTDFSPCDNISNMSVMSTSCYSDSSSVMTPMSPSDFTPPPSISNTPTPPVHDKHVTEDQQCNYSFINENSRSEPIHLYSPTMLSVTPYKLCNEKIEPNLMNYGRGQEIKRYYPSMADIHNSRSGYSIPSTSSKFETTEMFEFSDYRKSNKNQIQSDKISTSTTRSACTKKNITGNYTNQLYTDYVKPEVNDFRDESRRLRHNEPLRQIAIRIMSQWYEEHLDNPYPTKEDKIKMARDGGITVTQVKSWFANKRNRTNNTKPKVQKRAMKEKLKKLFQDLKHSRSDSLDNSHIIQQLSGIIQT